MRSPAENVKAAAFAARLLDKAGIPDNTLLDFGAGQGIFATEVQALGYTVFGLELADRDRRIANDKGIVTVRTVDELGSRRFGAVLARHVIEHVPDPVETVVALRRLLRPGGVLLIGVPNLASTAARLLRDGWEWFAPPAHLWYFAEAPLARLVRRAGFEPIDTTTTQGDASPLPLALAVGLARSRSRHQAPAGFWRRASGAGDDSPVRGRPSATVRAAYLAALRLVKRAWPWGNEELWMACRAPA